MALQTMMMGDVYDNGVTAFSTIDNGHMTNEMYLEEQDHHAFAACLGVGMDVVDQQQERGRGRGFMQEEEQSNEEEEGGE
jgi:hypothetical protein